MKILLLGVMLAGYAPAQPQMLAPQQGMTLDRSGALRPLVGIAQTFTTGDPVQTGVVSAACGKSLCVVRKADSDPPGQALISIEGDSALLYFPATRQFARIRGEQLTILDWATAGDVLTLRGDRIVVKREDGVRILTPTGAVLGSLPNDTTAALLLHGLTIYSTPDVLVLSRPDGAEIRYDLRGVISLTQIGERYVEVMTTDSTYALRIDAGKEQLSLLPQSSPEVKP
jgi:hypothetical protein